MMEALGTIMARAVGSHRQEDSGAADKRPPHYTSRDVYEGRLRCEREVPKPEICEFCGKKLYHTAIVNGNLAMLFSPVAERCTCEKAAAKWKAYDEAEARKKQEAEEAERRKRQMARIERLLGKSGIKKRFQQRTFENFIQDTPERKRCYKIAKSYAAPHHGKGRQPHGGQLFQTAGVHERHPGRERATRFYGARNRGQRQPYRLQQ